MNKWDSNYRDPSISQELEDRMQAGFGKTMADDNRRAKQRRCASCVGHSAIVAKSGYSEVEWAKAVGQSRCDACIWRENYNRRFASLRGGDAELSEEVGSLEEQKKALLDRLLGLS
jgi:hypothetical protein